MKLSQLQQTFVVLVAKLIIEANDRGFKLTFGEAYRPPETAELYAKQGRGIKNSLHTQRQAIDFNLFIDGVYRTDGDAYKPLGEYWESLSCDDYKCVWGGRFNDGNHFEIRGTNG